MLLLLRGAAMSKPHFRSVDRDPDLLTITQAAKVLNIRPVTVKRWVEQGLPTVRIGRRVPRIRLSVLVTTLTAVAPAPHLLSSPRLPPTWRLLRGGRDNNSSRR